jgi:predicted glycosyltransferase involved in capsule biosynthesis
MEEEELLDLIIQEICLDIELEHSTYVEDIIIMDIIIIVINIELEYVLIGQVDVYIIKENVLIKDNALEQSVIDLAMVVDVEHINKEDATIMKDVQDG